MMKPNNILNITPEILKELMDKKMLGGAEVKLNCPHCRKTLTIGSLMTIEEWKDQD